MGRRTEGDQSRRNACSSPLLGRPSTGWTTNLILIKELIHVKLLAFEHRKFIKLIHCQRGSDFCVLYQSQWPASNGCRGG
jgi:hypothetical protein